MIGRKNIGREHASSLCMFLHERMNLLLQAPRKETTLLVPPTHYSSTCHGRPPLVQGKSGPSWQVAPRDRERTYAPLRQIKHTHQTAYISQHMHNIIKHSGQLQCCIQWEMKRTMLKMCEKSTAFIHSNAYMWTHTSAVLYFKICRSNRRRFEMSHGDWPL